MDTSPLVIDEIEAGEAFLKRIHHFRPVIAACWLRRDESEELYLYAALDGLTDKNIDSAYGEVLRITQEMTDHYIDPFKVKLITPDHPVTKAIRQIYQRFPGRRIPSRVSSHSFGGASFVEAYIYQPIADNVPIT